MGTETSAELRQVGRIHDVSYGKEDNSLCSKQWYELVEPPKGIGERTRSNGVTKARLVYRAHIPKTCVTKGVVDYWCLSMAVVVGFKTEICGDQFLRFPLRNAT